MSTLTIAIYCMSHNLSLQNVSISVDLNNASHNVSKQFLSVTLGSSRIRSNWLNIDFKSERMINLGKALAPAMLRIGGRDEEFLLFSENSDEPQYDSFQTKTTNYTNFTLNASQWDTINQYAQASGWEIIFGLNEFLRTSWPDGDWDSTNAEKLMRYSVSKGYQVNWELGNGIYIKVINFITCIHVH